MAPQVPHRSKSLTDIADDMREIDIAMLATRTPEGQITSRPMSNNGNVEYQGDSYYFTREPSRLVSEIEHDPRVALSFTVKPGLLSGGGTFINVQGDAQLVRDRGEFETHWAPDLEAWFEQGLDTPGLVMIKVRATHVRYWYGTDQGEFDV